MQTLLFKPFQIFFGIFTHIAGEKLKIFKNHNKIL